MRLSVTAPFHSFLSNLFNTVFFCQECFSCCNLKSFLHLYDIYRKRKILQERAQLSFNLPMSVGHIMNKIILSKLYGRFITFSCDSRWMHQNVQQLYLYETKEGVRVSSTLLPTLHQKHLYPSILILKYLIWLIMKSSACKLSDFCGNNKYIK